MIRYTVYLYPHLKSRRSNVKYFLSILLIIGLLSFAYADDIKIACLGNSITAYHGSYTNIDLDSYPAQLRILMPEGYNIMNFGVSGTTMLKNGDYPYWDEPSFDAALEFEPDIVTILFGTNDSKPQNWVYKDEFVNDYIAMIDTLRTLPSNPEIYTMLPPPAFSSKYDINDSIIVNDIVPMIQQIAAEKNTKIIDFYTLFLDKPYLSYDGIHPVHDGLWLYAKEINKAITQDTVQLIQEVNLAKDKTVQAANGIGAPENLVDNNFQTGWICEENATITIDLGGSYTVGMVQFLLYEPTVFNYTIETSEDNTNWAPAASADDPGIKPAVIENIDPVNAQYIRVTFNPGDQAVRIAELRVLEDAVFYPPVMTYTDIDHFSKSFVRVKLHVLSCHEGGNIKYISADSSWGIFQLGIGYRHMDDTTKTQLIKIDQEKFFVAKFYMDGIEVESDTLHVDFSVTGIEDDPAFRPDRFSLLQNYPNPFNPSTTIQYVLRNSGKVKLTVYNCLGEKITSLVDQFQQAGEHSIEFHPAHLSSGLYVYSLEADGMKTIKKMLYLK